MGIRSLPEAEQLPQYRRHRARLDARKQLEKKHGQEPYSLAPYYADYSIDSEVLVIAFNCHNAKATSYEWDYRFSTWTELKFKRLYLFDPRAYWWVDGFEGYPGIDGWGKLVRQQIKKSEAKYVIAMGASMGGYGAIMIGALANVDSVLAFSPQTLATSGYRKIKFDCRKIIEKQDDIKTIFHIYYGKFFMEDAIHAKNLKSTKGVVLHPMKTHQHNTAKLLVDDGRMHKILLKEVIKWQTGSENLKKVP
jgi:hypothetical protein